MTNKKLGRPPRPEHPARARARAAGERIYHTGQPCQRGHFAGRYVIGNHCVRCMYENRKRREERLGRGGGVRCPACTSPYSEVVDTRQRANTTRRRRTCLNGHSFYTLEVLECQTTVS